MHTKVVEALRQFGRERRTGVLACEWDRPRRNVAFHEGGVVAARSSLVDERLGEVLVRRGRITAEHLRDGSVFARKGKRFGQVLVDLGIVGADELDSLVRLQLLEIATTVVLEPPRRMKFTPARSVPAVVTAPVTINDVLMEAARRTERIDEEIEKLMGEERRLALTEKATKLIETLRLEPHEAFILSRIDGTVPPRAVFAVTPLPEEQTARAILGHLLVGTLELRESSTRHGLALKK